MSGHKVVMVSAPEVFAWSRKWPGSGMSDKDAVAFTFEPNGDLVDIEPAGWDDDVDGAAVVALSQDAQQGLVGTVVGGAHGTPLRGTPHVSGNPRARFVVRRQEGSRRWCVVDTASGEMVEGGFFDRHFAEEEADRRNAEEGRASSNPRRTSHSGVSAGEWQDSERPGISYRAHPWQRGFGYKWQRIDVLAHGNVIGFLQTRVTFKRGRMPERVSSMTGTLSGGGVVGHHVDWLLREVNAANRGDFGVHPPRSNPEFRAPEPHPTKWTTYSYKQPDQPVVVHESRAEAEAYSRMRPTGDAVLLPPAGETEREIARWSSRGGKYVLVLDRSPWGYFLSGSNFGNLTIMATTDDEAIAKVQEMVNRGVGAPDRAKTPLARKNPGDVHIDIHSHNARGGKARAVANPVKLKSALGSWILALSFFERYRRGSEAKLGHNTVLRERRNADGTRDVQVVYHETPIVTYHEDDTVTLNSGGWQTKTTKDRMNILLPSSLGVVQKKGKWYVVDTQTWEQVPYFDGMRVGVKP